MRIDYNILWFENEDGWLRPTVRNLRTFLDDYGFKLNVITEKDNSNVAELIRQIKDNVIDIDVVFMDYRLAKEQKGDLIIEEIRKTELFTEIVFYSQDTDVKAVIEKTIGSVEGIYYSGRDIFLDKAKNVINHSIKKVQEVNSMRGLILAAVSDIDENMLEIIQSVITNDKAIGDEVKKYTYEVCDGFLKIKAADFDKYVEEDNIIGLTNDTLIFDSYKKARVLQKIVSLKKDPDLTHLKGFLESFNKGVIKPRNAFGHVAPQVIGGKRVLVPKRGEDIIFNDAKCIEIRKCLIEHSGHVETIKGKIAM